MKENLEELMELWKKNPEKLKAVSKQLIGLGKIKDGYSYGTIIDEDGEEILQECWGDGERLYFNYLIPSLAQFFAEVHNSFPALYERLRVAEKVVKDYERWLLKDGCPLFNAVCENYDSCANCLHNEIPKALAELSREKEDHNG